MGASSSTAAATSYAEGHYVYTGHEVVSQADYKSCPSNNKGSANHPVASKPHPEGCPVKADNQNLPPKCPSSAMSQGSDGYISECPASAHMRNQDSGLDPTNMVSFSSTDTCVCLYSKQILPFSFASTKLLAVIEIIV